MFHEKNKKGITPVIALVMLMLVTVGIVGISATWFSGIFSSQTKKFISIPAGGAYCSGGEIKVYALNSGDSAITTSDILVAQVDGVDVKNTPFFGDMSSGLVGWWKFDEGTGATATDSSGNGNTGALTNMDPLSDWVAGRSGKALDFDGINDYVYCGTGASLDLTSVGTVGAWVKINSYPTAGKYPNIVAKGAAKGWDTPGYTIWINGDDGKIKGEIASAISARDEVSFGTPSAGAWHHLTFVWDGSYLKAFVDGAQFGASIAQTRNANPAGQPCNIGRSPTAIAPDYFNGLIDDVKIYNKANAAVNIPPSGSGLVVNYPGMEGKHTIKIGTSSGVAESAVTCA